MGPKDLWLIDCVNNYLCTADLENSLIQEIISIRDEQKRNLRVVNLTNSQKTTIIRLHEENLRNNSL